MKAKLLTFTPRPAPVAPVCTCSAQGYAVHVDYDGCPDPRPMVHRCLNCDTPLVGTFPVGPFGGFCDTDCEAMWMDYPLD
jgi:hypothetical protein